MNIDLLVSTLSFSVLITPDAYLHIHSLSRSTVKSRQNVCSGMGACLVSIKPFILYLFICGPLIFSSHIGTLLRDLLREVNFASVHVMIDHLMRLKVFKSFFSVMLIF